MNLLDTIAVTSRSFSKNEDLVNVLKAKYAKVIFNDSGATLQGQELINFLSSGSMYQVISLKIIISGFNFSYNEKFKKLLTNKLFFSFGYFFLDFLITVSEISVP